MLERYELEAFLTLAEELHFGRSAQRLHISTARVSQTIAKLERRIGVPLFHRTSRRVELSPVGRQLYEETRPAWDRITDAFTRAVDAGRGLTGLLRVAFDGPAAGQLMVGATQAFRARHPDCDVQLREAQLPQVLPWLRSGEADVALTGHPIRDDVVMGPVLVREARMLAVPTGHPFARRTAVSVEDLARVTVLRIPETLPDSLRDDRAPRHTPTGQPITHGPAAMTFTEMLTLVGAGEGVATVGAHTRRYFARPDVTYVPFKDAAPVEWGLVWLVDGATARIRAFSQAALGVVQEPTPSP
ncbi:MULTISPECIES: LysR family transcriptional regulator [Streptomycetaceae]|uniref:Transcriptional regulator, LysR family n=1 Tax=Streptantibioticus cattleyicolor (strain ATCC 35852 / DSM 46488 / JCM 4925 / NBRC 14057 / NRRL 8057) TaxID=1003195 RepID=F8JUW4_STREN|nr:MULTISPECIES: LysR family transcriptional regulator [Streptomycetaceae]AEW98126.1 transcriptional regulator, LysR family [Streptantibioticus cattleyicolor NRRL 8057 = DSM 46488]MYS62515.1 LysR family transcriptional regulator [Streptomyces sp. SID5468]CCB78439.1 Transcriptional regulator, LysR family [Streptantibioticus cattleyicolor NRRL 8057 = DSM 46488]